MPAPKKGNKQKPAAAQSAKSRVTVINFVLDSTSSMIVRAQATIDGFNGYVRELRDQAKSNGANFMFSLTMFDSSRGIRVIHKLVTLDEVKSLDGASYAPEGMTPLYDAIATALNAVSGDIQGMQYDEKNVLTVILTDGEENSSKEYNKNTLDTLIKAKEALGWTFVYLGVAKDAWTGTDAFVGTSMNSNNMRSSGVKGLQMSYTVAAAATSRFAGRADVGAPTMSFYTNDEVDAVAAVSDDVVPGVDLTPPLSQTNVPDPVRPPTPYQQVTTGGGLPDNWSGGRG